MALFYLTMGKNHQNHLRMEKLLDLIWELMIFVSLQMGVNSIILNG